MCSFWILIFHIGKFFTFASVIVSYKRTPPSRIFPQIWNTLQILSSVASHGNFVMCTVLHPSGRSQTFWVFIAPIVVSARGAFGGWKVRNRAPKCIPFNSSTALL
jgi:hypothetical protein